MVKFKVGDMVDIVKSTYEGRPHLPSQKYVGKIGKITEIDNEAFYPINVKVKGLGEQAFVSSDLKLSGKKEPKINFLLQYELEEDPIEEFETEKEVKDRIKELSERRDLQEDSLIVYDVSRVRKITLKRELVIEGL